MLRYRKLCSGNNMNCTTKGCYVVWSPATRLPVLISLDKSCFLTCYTMTSKGMPEEMNLSDVKQIHQTGRGSTLDTTGAGCSAATESTAFMLMGVVMLLPWLW
ncbi:glypican-5-like isoform X1 [Mirounga leonina]|uniref:glypican-5-like isoform X1 n=1 Tax=Mirounga leonina TaxID=9715 RepID=UPI00156C2334|nr:glypican-5-like isoform X1 [Mirounga leonina]